MDQLIALDRTLFEKINGSWSHPALDWLMPKITDLHREPLFLAAMLPLLLLCLWRFRGAALKWVLVLGLSIGAADAFSYRVLKALVHRDRPQYSGVPVVLRTDRHSGMSFPSNHAANMFAAASTLSVAAPPWTPLFYLIALLVGYSRIYVGVHFPLDVLAGAFVGIACAWLVRRILRPWLPSRPRRIAPNIAMRSRNAAGSFRERS